MATQLMATSVFANIKPTPRTKLAAKLWATGAAPSKRAASRMAGLHPHYLTLLTNPRTGSRELMEYIRDLETRIDDGTVQMSQVLQELGRRAVSKMARLMEMSGKDEVQLRAAIELADRSPETQKVQKAEITTLTISGEDAKQLAAAMLESARHDDDFNDVASKGLVEIDTDDRGETPIPQLKLLSVTDAIRTRRERDESPERQGEQGQLIEQSGKVGPATST